MKTVVLNESDSALDAFCMCRGTSIVFLDEQLAALPDDNVNKRELTRLRSKVQAAHQRKDLGELDGWLHALLIGLKAACHTIPLAVTGEKFKKNSGKVRTGGPIRVAIAKLLKKARDMKNKTLWDTIAAKPPKGWEFLDNDMGKYADGDGGQAMTYRRFCNVCAEERAKLKA